MYKNNKKFWAGKIVGFIVCGALLLALVGYVVMLLWNNVLVQVVNVSLITFWQAVGLLILSKILFGGFGGRRWSPKSSWRQGWKEKWEEKFQHMSPEEREKIKEEWRSRCRVWGKKDEETTIL